MNKLNKKCVNTLQVAKQERSKELSISYVYFIYLLYICFSSLCRVVRRKKTVGYCQPVLDCNFFVTNSCCLDSVGGWQQTLAIDIIAIIYLNPLSIYFTYNVCLKIFFVIFFSKLDWLRFFRNPSSKVEGRFVQMQQASCRISTTDICI